MVIVGMICYALGEIMVRLLEPGASRYPNQHFSLDYGPVEYPNRRIVHVLPGQWRFEYTTNRFGHRGGEPEVSSSYPVPNVLLLGDSYTFGIGLSDEDELGAVLRRTFAGRAGVINLATQNWGLAQQIRRYYELGQVFQPKVVILVFCSNDPSENLEYPVTKFVDGRFVFQSAPHDFGMIERFVKRYFPDSWLIQKSQLYVFARYVAYKISRREEEVAAAMENREGASGKVSKAERNHAELLEAFANDLESRGVGLVMISVPGQLQKFRYITGKVEEFNRSGLLRYVEVRDWVGENGLDESPEGHWGPETLRSMAEHLVPLLEQDYLARK
ncbi:MAG: hypothetical protein NFCOHLIN_00833 [Gammaproteobacteria bacterium]|nr:hypothetical protein [Gammaproteobacteria bacterium]